MPRLPKEAGSPVAMEAELQRRGASERLPAAASGSPAFTVARVDRKARNGARGILEEICPAAKPERANLDSYKALDKLTRPRGGDQHCPGNTAADARPTPRESQGMKAEAQTDPRTGPLAPHRVILRIKQYI